MKKPLILLQFFLLLFLAWACQSQLETELSVTAGNWGHLSGITKTNPSKLYLSHVAAADPYKICLAKSMVARYPGIKSEIVAGVNIWAHYIGRDIKVEITEADIPDTEEDDDIKLADGFYAKCPKDVHLVMGDGVFTDDAVGKTRAYSYKYEVKNGKHEVKSFKRYLLLKRPVSAEEADTEDSVVVWKTLSQVLGKELTPEEILEILKKRDQKIFLTGNHELLTLKTIIHEFGHIWGLCDQYALDGNGTNCDGKFATINAEGHIILHDEAVMSSSSWQAKLYLADDDIEGIRRLAERSEFAGKWPKKDVFRKLTIPAIVETKALPLVKLHHARLNRTDTTLLFSLATNTAATLKVRVKERNSDEWISFGDIDFPEPITYKNYTLNLNTGYRLSPEKVEVTMTTVATENLAAESVTMEAPVEREAVKASQEPEYAELPSFEEF